MSKSNRIINVLHIKAIVYFIIAPRAQSLLIKGTSEHLTILHDYQRV